MQRPTPFTWDFKTPSGIMIKLKKLSYGENKSVLAEILGEAIVGEKTDITLSQGQELISIKLLKSIVDWDITEADGSKTPITQKNLEDILSEEDFNALSTEISAELSKKK
jgi:hypothetical protein